MARPCFNDYKVGDKVILRETPSISGVVVHKHTFDAGDGRIWSVHWYSSVPDRGVYKSAQIKRKYA